MYTQRVYSVYDFLWPSNVRHCLRLSPKFSELKSRKYFRCGGFYAVWLNRNDWVTNRILYILIWYANATKLPTESVKAHSKSCLMFKDEITSNYLKLNRLLTGINITIKNIIYYEKNEKVLFQIKLKYSWNLKCENVAHSVNIYVVWDRLLFQCFNSFGFVFVFFSVFFSK